MVIPHIERKTLQNFMNTLLKHLCNGIIKTVKLLINLILHLKNVRSEHVCPKDKRVSKKVVFVLVWTLSKES